MLGLSFPVQRLAGRWYCSTADDSWRAVLIGVPVHCCFNLVKNPNGKSRVSRLALLVLRCSICFLAAMPRIMYHLYPNITAHSKQQEVLGFCRKHTWGRKVSVGSIWGCCKRYLVGGRFLYEAFVGFL